MKTYALINQSFNITYYQLPVSGKQIRNVAAVGGNIMTGSPISDLNPIFMAAGATLTIQSSDQKRNVPFDQNFYTGYRKNLLKPNEVLISIMIPFTNPGQYFYAYKQARRRDDDIAIVNAAFSIEVTENLGVNKLESIKMAFGGMGPTTLLACDTMEVLQGLKIDEDLLETACSSLQKELCLAPDAPGAMVRYRQSLVLSFFFKMYLSLTSQIGSIKADALTATMPFEKEPLQSHQLCEIKNDSSNHGALGKPIKHKSADHQVDGSAQYTDDIPHIDGELYAGLVLSTKAHAEILNIDVSHALAMEGVHEWVSSKDLKDGRNVFGTAVFRDEVVFAEEKVYCIGMIIGVIIADDQETAQKAARKVKIDYKELPAVITIEDAIEANSFHAPLNAGITSGDVDSIFIGAKNIVEGEMRTGAQEQFYLETNACIAIPKMENDEMEIWSSTQNPTSTQKVVAGILGVSVNR